MVFSQDTNKEKEREFKESLPMHEIFAEHFECKSQLCSELTMKAGGCSSLQNIKKNSEDY